MRNQIILVVILIVLLEIVFALKFSSTTQYVAPVTPKVAVEHVITHKKAHRAIRKQGVAHYTKPVVTLETKAYIDEIFGEKAETATAVLMHESGLRLDAINYNCRYNGKSKTCKVGDEKNSISLDCGIAQINFKGKVCPKELLTLKGNMEAVAKIYKSQGLKAWVSFTTGRYKVYL